MSHTSSSRVRPPAVANAFYPGDPNVLRRQVQQLLSEASAFSEAIPKALIAPHAGYVYSGPIAATAYKTLLPLKEKISRVVLLGPAHRVYLQGMGVPSATHFLTPLGKIPLEIQTLQELTQQYSWVNQRDDAHEQEHSLEVHLPFLQETLRDFVLLPLVVGTSTPAEVAQVLQHVWGGEETLLVISSDLSHFENYSTAQKLDLKTAEAIESFEIEALRHEGACGYYPVRGLLAAAKHFKLQVRRLDLRNSGDTAGDHSRVVGYGSWLFYLPSD
ncbi:AmmeMemoRadiSam system protein B [Deltaproteobacteria bacterium TL4]